MATVDKSFVFASDNEGLTGDYWAWLSSDGSPSNGCLQYTGGVGSGNALKTSTADTWETWGVPSGATVTNAQLTAWKYKVPVRSRASAAGSMLLVDSSGTTIVTLAGSYPAMSAVVSAWTDGAAGSSQSVGASYQASNTSVRLKIVGPYGSTFDNGDLRLDTITITITYTEGGGSTFKQSRALLGVGW